LTPPQGKASPVPASEGNCGGLWFDQKTLLVCNPTQTKLLTLDLGSGKWIDFFTGTDDGRFLVP